MKKDYLKIWCDQLWLHVLYLAGIIMSCILVFNWDAFSVPTKLMCLLTILIPLHVFEENTFPGGFFYMNNIGQKSEAPLVYPQNMLTNMYTNLGAEILFIIITIFAEQMAIAAVTIVIVFGFAELLHHTKAGISMYKRYKGKGKRTLYGPGLITCYVGLIQLSCCGLSWLVKQDITPIEVVAGIGVVLFVAVFMILIPFAISKRVKSQRFAFRDSGYFSKYER